MNFYKKILPAVLALISSVAVQAQEQSPYSRYGYGIIKDYATSAQRSMGGVGIAMQGGRQINVMNPASYAGMDSLTLLWDVGLDVTRLWSEEGGDTGKSFGGGLDYLTMQFPIGKYMGGSIGLVPYSSVGYSFGGDVDNGSSTTVTGTSSFLGAGGINELYLGLSGRLFKGFSVGANFSYQFGSIINDSYIYDSSNTNNQSLFEQSMEIRDWNVLIGVQYTKEFNLLHRFTLGATYSPGKDLHGKTWGVKYDVNSDTEPDTIGYSKLNGDYSKPDAYGVGLSYTYDDRFTVEGDFNYQKWSKAKFLNTSVVGDGGSKAEQFADKWKASLGMQFVPKTRGNYLQRIAYRCGGFYNRDYITVNGNNTRSYGASVGFGFPTLGTKTIINLGFEYMRRESYPASNLVGENYFSITLGVNFNEFAFWQDKIR